THSERFERARAEGGPIHAIQSWVALPEADEETTPSFANHPAHALPLLDAGGSRLRLVAGEAFGARSPGRTHSPRFYAPAELARDAALPLPTQHAERAAFVVSGAVSCGGERFAAGKLLVFTPGGSPALSAAEPATVMLLGGAPLGKRYVEWNFVS